MECPAAPPTTQRFTVILSSAAVVGEQGQIGTLVVERDLDLIQDRAAVTVSIAAGMLLFAGALAALLANRLTRRVSDPIAHLAVAARSIGHAGEDRQALGNIAAPPDEVGELVTAFRGMVGRLLQSNDALRHEIDQRGKMEAEREELLVRERETSRLKDEFLAAVSHELRTPLNAILGWVQMLGSTGLNPEMTAKAVASIGRNAQAQTRVIEDLVDVSRIVTGKLHLRLELVELRTATAGAIDVIRPVAAAKRVSIETEFTSEASLVMADEVRVRQILWNLLSNAVKFTPAGGTVTVALQSDDGMHEIAVSDSGVGIRQEFLPYVFDRFRQADGSMTREYGGLGLGLSIVKDLTEAHGGSVAVSSRGEGLGATFRVRLPRAGEGTAETQPQRPS
jgi:signal transduction histidine kinase